MERLWPSPLSRVTRTAAIRFAGAKLHVAMVEPWNVSTRTALEAFTGCPVVPALMLADNDEPEFPQAEIEAIITEHWTRRTSVPLVELLAAAAERTSRRDASPASASDPARTPEIILAVHGLLVLAAAVGASDVHLDPGQGHLRIRFRVDGRLREIERASPMLLQPLLTRLSMLGGHAAEPVGGVLDGAFRVAVSPTRQIEVRLAIVPALNGPRCSLRLVDRDARLPSLSDLGMNAATQRPVIRAVSEPNGLVVVTGPTGSGKTSTLYSLLDRTIAADAAIVTVEDPVERQLAGVVQVPCNEDAGLDFASVLRALLRQDPDVIMVGEVRDAETAALAVRAASTGHLVLTSLHSNSASSTVTRLLGLGLEPYVLASVLRVVIAQRLVRRLRPKCKTAEVISAETWSQAGGGTVAAPVAAYAARGCEACVGTGYAGRLGVFEGLTITAPMRELMLKTASEAGIERIARDHGMRTLREVGLDQVRAGCTSLSEVLAVTRWEPSATAQSLS